MKPVDGRGQALIEFAILGSLGLLALAFLIQIGLRANYQQEMEQHAFRRALAAAQAEGDTESQSIQVQAFRDRQVPNPSQGFAIMPRTLSSGAGTVTWGELLTLLDDARDSQPRIIVELNDARREFRSEDLKKDEPLIHFIHKTLDSQGTMTQDNAGSDLDTSTTETTDLEFNTKSPSTLSSTTHSNVRFDW